MDRFRNLRNWNLAMGVLHLIQGAVMIVVSTEFTIPIVTNFLQFNPEAQVLLPQQEVIFDLQLGPLVASFLLLSSIAHFAISTPGIYEWYVKNLKKGLNYARWIEYSVSSSVMMVVVAMLVGVYDLSTLILIFSINATMILFGWVMEVHNQLTKKVDWTSYIFGCFAGIVPWVIVALYLFGSGEGEYRAPDFVYWIFFSIFLFFNSFAVNMVLQYKKVGAWKDYTYGEKVYIVMSLVAKSALAWQVWAGTLRPV